MKFVEKFKTQLLHSITLFLPENHTVYGTIWKNALDPDKPEMTNDTYQLHA
jgi:hypothetical protein